MEPHVVGKRARGVEVVKERRMGVRRGGKGYRKKEGKSEGGRERPPVGD